MLSGVEMFCRVLVGRIVAAADVTAGAADPQMQPYAAALQTFLATERARRDVADAGDVGAALRHSDHALKRRFRRIAKKTVQRGYHLCALPDRAAHALDRSRAHIADGEHARHRGFQRRHRPSLILFGLRARHYEAAAIERDAATIEPAGGRTGAREQEPIADADDALF